MKRFAPFLFACSFFLAAPATTSPQSGPVHAPDFRAPQRIAPLYFPPKPNAPFMAVANTLWVRTLPDGSTVSTQNARVVARDTDGRIYQERRTFVPVPDNGKQPSVTYATQYSDPVGHTVCRCDPRGKICNLFPYDEPAENGVAAPAGLQPDKTTYLTRENLGVDTLAGLEVQRSRETYTFYSETVGNTKTILRTVEYWYSPALGINVQVKRHDPRDGDQTLWLSDLSLSAPAPETFRVPSDYRIVDDRRPEPVRPPMKSAP